MDSSKILWGIKKAGAIAEIYANAQKAALENPFAAAVIFHVADNRARQVAQTPQFYDATIKSVGAAVNFNQA